MKSNSPQKQFLRMYWPALVLALFCLLLQIFDLIDALRYDRDLIDQGQWWRYLSANFVHLNWSHLGLNIGALGLAWSMFGSRLNPLEWFWVIVLSSLATSLGTYYFNPELIWLVGLSGTMHGIVFAGVWRELRYDKFFSLAVGGWLIGKLIYEQIWGPLPGSETTTGGKVIVDAHLYGGIGGIIAIASIDTATVTWLVLSRLCRRLKLD